MANEVLVNYIKSTEKMGYTPEQVREFLIQKEYAVNDIDESLKAAGMGKAVPVQPASPIDIKQVVPKPASGGIKKRNPFLVLLFTIITGGIYGLYWIISTTNELRRNTSKAPNPWLLLTMLIPLVNIIIAIIYYIKYCKAINELTGFSTVGMILLMLFVSPVGIIIAQIQLNKKA